MSFDPDLVSVLTSVQTAQSNSSKAYTCSYINNPVAMLVVNMRNE